MNALSGVFWSQIVIFIGAIFMALGGLGVFHFSRKIESEKDAEAATQQSELNQKISDLVEGNKRLQDGNDSLNKTLEPFKEYALGRFPDADVSTALKKLEADLKRIDEITTPTVFKVASSNEAVGPNGKHIVEFTLDPIGKTVVPILTIIAQSGDGTRVESIGVTGPTVPIMATTGSSANGDAQKIEYRTVSPGPMKVVVTFAKKPVGATFSITPLFEAAPAQSSNP